MSPNSTSVTIAPQVEQRLADLRLRLRIPMIQRLIQERAFTETERQQIESETEARIEAEFARLRAEKKRVTKRRRQEIESEQRDQVDFIGFWSRTKKVSRSGAIADLAFSVDLISAGEHLSLLRDLGEANEPPNGEVPVWNRKTGKLSYRGRLARKVSGVKRAKNLVAILDEFERRGWPEWIPNPLAGRDDQTLREAIADLSRGLAWLVFRSSDSGVLWEVDSAAHRPRDGLRQSQKPR
jgi:hypothetical protein